MSIPLDRLYHFIENIAEEIYDGPRDAGSIIKYLQSL